MAIISQIINVVCSHELANFWPDTQHIASCFSVKGIVGYISMYNTLNVQNNSLIAWF